MTDDAVHRARVLTSALQNAVGIAATDLTWRQVAAYLETVTHQVDGLRRQLERLRVVGGAPNVPQLQRVRHSLDRVRDAFNLAPDQLAQGEIAATLRGALTAAVVEHRDRANAQWLAMREAVLIDASEGLLRLYAAIPDAREVAQKATSLRSRLSSTTTPPTEPLELMSLKQVADSLREHLEQLRRTPLPVEVGRFLDPALRGEARWAQLSPDVLSWLEDHDMLTAIRLKIV